MKIKDKEVDLKKISKVVLCIAVGTAVGLGVYAVFLYFNLAIFGWNLGLAFAPLAAGYAETLLAKKILGEGTGAVSALILFLDTTYYSFILKNTTLGMNIITAGSIVVILQAAFPTLINYILLVVIGSTLSNFKWVFKEILKPFKAVKSNVRWETEDTDIPIEELPQFDEKASNEKLNSLDFFFFTSTDMKSRKHEIVGIHQSEVFIENKKTISVKVDEIEHERLVHIKEGKDECLIKLAETVKSAGGNAVLDLEIQYGLVGMGGDNIHITATGMGINIRDV